MERYTQGPSKKPGYHDAGGKDADEQAREGTEQAKQPNNWLKCHVKRSDWRGRRPIPIPLCMKPLMAQSHSKTPALHWSVGGRSGAARAECVIGMDHCGLARRV